MNSKFIFMLCLIFYGYENVSSYKAESVSLPIKKFQSLINSSASDVLKTNQDKDVSPANQENVQKASNYSWGSWNTSSNHPKSPQTYFGNRNIIIKKEKGIALTRNDSAFVKKLYETLSTNVPNVSLFGLPVNTTTPGENVQPKIMKHDLVDKSNNKENIASSSTVHANMIENEPTNGSPRKRLARAKANSVDSVIDKLFEEDFSERGRKRQRQPDASRERSSRRRQKMKKLERFGEGEVFYFRDAETTTTNGAETTASGGEEITTSSGEETTASGGTGTTTASEAETTATGGTETTTSSGTKTTSGSGLLEETGPNVNRHYHFHYFGVSPPQNS